MIGRKQRILVVDQDQNEVKKLQDLLGDSYFLEGTDKPEKALVNIQKKFYSAILCELNFGDVSGISLLKNIRQKYENYNFLLFSAELNSEEAAEALNCGADGFIRKPLTEEQDLKILKKVLSRDIFSHKRHREKDYGMENELNLLIQSEESDILNAMEIADQMLKILYPKEYGNFDDLKIALYEALNNAKLYGSASNSNRIYLRVEFKHDRIICHVKDQGSGFDIKKISFVATDISATYSGLPLIAALTDCYSFNSSGTEINFLKLLKKPQDPPKSSLKKIISNSDH